MRRLLVCLLLFVAPPTNAAAPPPALLHTVKVVEVGGQRLRFVWVPPGPGALGNDEDERLRLVRATGNPFLGGNTVPRVKLKVTRGFWILDREVTEGQYAALVPGRKVTKANRDMPVRDVTWAEAMTFCRLLQGKCGRTARLPTEVEWEYAARGPDPRRYPWPAEGQFHACAEKGDSGAPRPWASSASDISWCGAFDMGGNVSEWCLDLYEPDHYARLEAGRGYDPRKEKVQSPAKGILPVRTYRGGSYLDPRHNCEVPTRRSLAQDRRRPSLGFRPVLVPTPPVTRKGVK